jgi:hypothetical protein
MPRAAVALLVLATAVPSQLTAGWRVCSYRDDETRSVSRENAIGRVQRNSSAGCSTLSASNQSKFLPTLRRAGLFGERDVGPRPHSKAAQSISLNRVGLTDQKSRGIQFIHFGEVFSRELEIVSERSAAFRFQKLGSSVEHLLYGSIQLLIVCRAELCRAPVPLIQLVAVRTHVNNLSDQAEGVPQSPSDGVRSMRGYQSSPVSGT